MFHGIIDACGKRFTPIERRKHQERVVVSFCFGDGFFIRKVFYRHMNKIINTRCDGVTEGRYSIITIRYALVSWLVPVLLLSDDYTFLFQEPVMDRWQNQH